MNEVNIQRCIDLVKQIANDPHPTYHRQERVMFNEIWDFDVCKYCSGDNGADVLNIKHRDNCVWAEARRIIYG